MPKPWVVSQTPSPCGDVSVILDNRTIMLGTYVVANVESLGDPVLGDATKSVGKAVDVLSGGTAVGVNVASKTGTVFRVADEEDTLDGVEVRTSQLGEGVGGSSGTLRVALEEEALAGVGLQGGLDLADNVGSSCGRVLRGVGSVDGVVNLATRQLTLDIGVHGAETSRRALGFTSTAGVDDGVARASVRPLDHASLGGGGSRKGEDDVLKLHDEEYVL